MLFFVPLSSSTGSGVKGKSRTKGFDKGIFILALIVLIIGASATLIGLQLRSDKITEDVKEGQLISVLILVHDENGLLFTELFLYHPTTGNGALLDIPGDWGDVIETVNRMDRIDVLYDPGNSEPFKEKIEELINLDISYTIDFSLDGLEDAVDMLEGIDLFIASPVEIFDSDGITLVPSGSVVLDGMKARTYVSYEDDTETELEYRSRHQRSIQAIIKKISENTDYLAVEQVFSVFYDSLNTSLGKRAARSFIEELRRLDADHLILKPVHGDKVKVGEQVLLFPHSEGKLARESVRQLVDALANTDVISERELTVVLEILNGTDKQGLAARTRLLFVNFGYEVERYANAATSDYEKTVVISRTGDLAAAQRVASHIRCKNIEQKQYIDGPTGADPSIANIDVTIILGMDFDGEYCKE